MKSSVLIRYILILHLTLLAILNLFTINKLVDFLDVYLKFFERLFECSYAACNGSCTYRLVTNSVSQLTMQRFRTSSISYVY